MAQFDRKKHVLVGLAGQLKVPDDDHITPKLLMLTEGECDGLGPLQAARKFGYSRQRYFQLRTAFAKQGRGRWTIRSAARKPITAARRKLSAKWCGTASWIPRLRRR